MQFTYTQGGTPPPAQNQDLRFSVSTDDCKTLGPTSLAPTALTITASAPWLSGARTAPSTVAVSVNPAGLTASTYNGTVNVTIPATEACPGGDVFPIAVSLTVSAGTTPPVTGTVLLVDFGASAGKNTFGLPGWDQVFKDTYTDHVAVGPGGLGIITGGNGTYNYQGVQGPARQFVAGEKIRVSWYNNSSTPITFTPQISFTDADRVSMGAAGSWHSMSSITVPASGTASHEYTVTPASAGSRGLVNINSNCSGMSVAICDKIELLTGSAPPPINTAPVVDAGPDQTIILPASVQLSATATDDGLRAKKPKSAMTYQWAGPAGVTFSAPTATATDAAFAAVGTYVLTFSANDGALTSSDSLTVTVQAAPASIPTIKFRTANNTTFSSDNKEFSVTVNDPVGVVKVELYVDSDSQPVGVQSVRPGAKHPAQVNVRWMQNTIAKGTYPLTAFAYNAAGAKSLPAQITVIRT